MRDVQIDWWALTVRGIFATLFGIAAVFWPGLTLVTLLYLFAAWILVDGVVRIIAGISRIGGRQMVLLTTLVGLLQVGLGVYLLRHPHVTFATFILLIGFMLIISGVVEVVSAVSSNDTATGKTLAIFVAAAAVLAGIFILFQPQSAGVAFVWILGLYAIVSGPILIAMSLDLHKLQTSTKRR